MKTKLLLVVSLCVASVLGCSAQKVKKDKKSKKDAAVVEQVKTDAPKAEVKEDADPVVTKECLTDVSLFSESVKNKQYADAVEPWYRVYEQCPNANKAIYSQGPKIIEWQLSQAQTEEEKLRLKQTLMEIYDKRMKYFGNDPKYPKAYILGEKAMDYCQYFTEDELKLQARDWFEESVDGMGGQSKVSLLNKYAEVSNNIYKSDPEKYGEQYIADYQKISDALTAIVNDQTNKNSGAAKQYKDYIDQIFANSGAANCQKLDELYAQAVQDNLQNGEELAKIMKLYRRVRCTESDVYFAAAEASHKLQPTAESAAGCAAMSAKKGDYKAAVDYYDQAFELADGADDKSNYLYNNALYCYQYLNQYSRARDYANRSLEVIPDQGRCYLLIGLMYASSKPYNDPVLNKTVFWVAVDQFNKAKQVDPTVVNEANKFIQAYSKFFPTTEEVFFQPELGKGKPFTVGGWIQRTTTCR
ncbi:MAG: hypothetical protein IJ834_08315 [Paludibacteraceae bacterium]|nr:hypothetical protein [Paludibacteraceae bacterium]